MTRTRTLVALLAVSFGGCSFDDTPIATRPFLPAPTGDAALPLQTQDASVIEASDDASTSGAARFDGAVAPPSAHPVLHDDGDAGATSAPAPSVDCNTSAQRFMTVAQTTCASCHGPGSAALGGFASVLDVAAMIDSGEIKPGNPESSPLFVQVSSGAMPPAASTPRPTADDIATIRTWIDCGAPNYVPPACQANCTSFVDIDARLTAMANDVSALEDQARSDVRYLDLTHYANIGQPQPQLALYRDALSYATNALSRQPMLTLPQAVDAQVLVFRIRLSDYGWTPALWEQLVADYPYSVTYDINSRTFPVNAALQTRLRTQTGTLTPYIQADWFFSHAVRPPLYYALLGVPGSLRQLEAQLGVDISSDIANQHVARAGFQVSGPSHFNRIIERHVLGANTGVLWLTYDFDAGTGFSNIFTHPLDFRQTSSEILFTMANGLHGYMSVDDRGTRLDKAPNGSVQDTRSSDLVVESGISCINCHAQTGVIVKHDEIRGSASSTITDLATTDAIFALYKDDATLDAAFADDRTRYQSALAALQLTAFTEGSAHALDDAYDGLLGSREIAGLLGIGEEQLLGAINATPGVFPAEALALRTPGHQIARDQFEAQFAKFVTALGLGTPDRP